MAVIHRIALLAALLLAGCGSNTHSGDVSTVKPCPPDKPDAVYVVKHGFQPEVTKVCTDIRISPAVNGVP